jgi:hypothetical protein
MHRSRPRRIGFLRASLPLVAGLSLLLAGAVLQPAAATAIAPLEVPLGEHRFGHLRQPDAVVVHAGPDEVGFESPPPGADGISYGPWSFDVARDGSIWLLDEVNQRLLVWRPGQPGRPARSLPLPEDPLDRVADFAVAPDGGIYASYVPAPGTALKTLRLAALDPSGKVRWTAPTTNEIFNARLRFGPDGTLYTVQPATQVWTPLATPAGRSLSLAEQRRRTSSRQPLPGGRWLTATMASPRRWDLTLGQGSDRPLRGWRVTSQTDLGALAATPALVGGDPVVTLEIAKQTAAKHLYEFEVLRLAPQGGTRQRFALAPDTRAVWGDTPITGVRIGPDGQLYRLRSDRKTGVSIARYSLSPTEAGSPTTTPGSGPPPATTPAVTQPPATQPPAAAATLPPASPAADQSTRWLIPGLAVLGAGLLAALGAWLLYRRNRPADPQDSTPGPGPTTS